MKRKPIKQSGFFAGPNLTALLIVAGGISLAVIGFAATPVNQKPSPKNTSSHAPGLSAPQAPSPDAPAAGPAPTTGTLSTSHRKATYTGHAGPVAKATGEHQEIW